jgi:hypothetical protein
MKEQKRIGTFGIIVLIVAGLWLYGSVTGDDDNEGSTATQAVVDERSPEEADIRIQARGSRCLAVASEARIYIFMSLRNFSDVAGSIDVVPIRRYSDGTRNDSVIDTMTAEIGPLERKTFRTPFDYNAVEHDLLECWLRVVGTDREIPIATGQGL